MATGDVTIKWHAGVAIRDPASAFRLKSGRLATEEELASGFYTVPTPGPDDPNAKPQTVAEKMRQQVEEKRRVDRTMTSSPYPRSLPQEPGIQVWCNDRLIGWLQVADREALKHPVYEIAIFDPPVVTGMIDESLGYIPPAGRNIRYISLTVDRRRAAMSEYEIFTGGPQAEFEHRKRYQIPENAVMEKNPMDGDTIFRWRVFRCNLDQSEEIFDLNEFIPNPELH